jgi:hypothetical protein
MKRIITLLVLTFTLVAARADQEYTGAYWITKAPAPVAREAGQMNLLIRDDRTCRVTTFFNGVQSITIEGVWGFSKTGKIGIYARREESFYALFAGNLDGGFGKGVFGIAFAGDFYKGSWQVTTP